MKPERITSRDNEKLKLARRVRDGRERDLIFVEGKRLFGEAVRSALQTRFVLGTPRFLESQDQFLTARPELHVYEVTEKLLGSVADTPSPQGVVMIADRPAPNRDVAFAIDDPSAIFLMLVEANNPSNLGAMIRTAEAVGASSVILSSGSADPFSAKSIRASMGSVFRVPIIDGQDPADVIIHARSNGVSVSAVDVDGVSIFDTEAKHRPTLFVFGSEAHGLAPETIGMVDNVVSIPMSGMTESLNLAVACGVVLYHAKYQK